MKSTSIKYILSVIVFTAICSSTIAQVPQGLNYQAVARDGENLIKDRDIGVRIAILSSIVPVTVQWEEEHIAHTNSYGLFQIIIGDPGATHTGGIATNFTDIDWTIVPLFIRTTLDIELNNNWIVMGDAQMVSVPYAMVTQSVSGLKKLSVTSATDIMDEALFEVKNNLGKTVFAVYNEGVRAHVGGAESKGKKGGFAVGSFDASKGDQDYLSVYPDSTRVYVQDALKGKKGGFAVGGFGAKESTGNYLDITKENYFIGHESGSKIDGGLYNSVIGYQAGMNLTSGSNNTILGYKSGNVNSTGTGNVFIGNSAGSGETGSNKLYIANSDVNPPLLYGDFSTNHLGINTTSLSRTMNVGGDIGATGSVYATNVFANVTGNVTGNINGDISGSVNGVEMGRIFLASDGKIQDLMGEAFLLSYKRGDRQIILVNQSPDYACTYWYRRTDGATSVTGTATLGKDEFIQIMPAEIKNELGFEIHFGESTDGKGYCSVWIQYFEGVVTGHYMKY